MGLVHRRSSSNVGRQNGFIARLKTINPSVKWTHCTGLFKKKKILSEMYFTKTTDVKSMFCVRMERKSLKVLISMI
jgi:hypothetical protein